MANQKASSPCRTFVLKVNCTCDGCKEKFRKLKKEIDGVLSVSIDAEQGWLTVTGTVGPYAVIEQLKKHKKNVELLTIERQPPKHISSPKPSLTKLEASPQVSHKSVLTSKSDEYCHSERDHRLKLIEGCIKRFTCNRCKVDGFGSRYRCDNCTYEIHDECRKPKPTVTPHYFDGLTFEYRHTPPPACGGSGNTRRCAACGKRILGHFYHCGEEKGAYLHPTCSRLRRCESIGGVEFVLRRQPTSKCIWCKRKKDGEGEVPGRIYVSRCDKYRLHVNCLTELVHEAWLNGAIKDGEDESTAVETMDLQLKERLRKKGGKGFGFWKPVGLLVRAVVGVVFGDVTGIVPMAVAIVELLSKHNLN